MNAMKKKIHKIVYLYIECDAETEFECSGVCLPKTVFCNGTSECRQIDDQDRSDEPENCSQCMCFGHKFVNMINFKVSHCCLISGDYIQFHH